MKGSKFGKDAHLQFTREKHSLCNTQQSALYLSTSKAFSDLSNFHLINFIFTMVQSQGCRLIHTCKLTRVQCNIGDAKPKQ